MNTLDLKFAALAAIMAVAVTGAALAAVTPAFAEDVVVTGTAAPTARIVLADLDLATAAGRATLDRRIVAAADRLYGYDGIETPQARIDRNAARKRLIADARAQAFALTERAGGNGVLTLAAR